MVVVGAGFAGLYALHSLRDRLGLSVRVLEQAGDVGGTWYWNRYPGARCDIESFNYSYSFSEELQQEWTWSERFAAQPEILAYLNHVADRFDLRRDIQFDTRVDSAVWDGVAHWEIGADDGKRVRARYLVTATGITSVPKENEFAGIEDFAGNVYSTSDWPHEGVDFSGRRVAVIGTGSSGTQIIPILAEQAAHLTVFQRTPNYATPIGNGPMDPEFQRLVKANYADLRRRSRETLSGLPFDQVQPSALAVGPDERRRTYQSRWSQGGFRLFQDSYRDLLVDAEANATAAEFIREKIRQRVADPEVAELLIPTDHPYGTKRPPLETNYYETFNRDNVTLVDVRQTPIDRFVPAGIRTHGSDHVFDSVVLATGFDAVTGALLRMGIRGAGGRTLEQHWAKGPRTNLGLTVHGFPNLFMVSGPQTPTAISNAVLAIEDNVEWITNCIGYLRKNGIDRIEPTREAEQGWVERTTRLAARTLLPQADSWWMGANVPGKPRVCMVYVGGGPRYRDACQQVAAAGYDGFTLNT